VTSLVEDSLRFNEAALTRHGIALRREFEDVPTIVVDKHRVLQILVNLIRNAKQACEESDCAEKMVTVAGHHERAGVQVSVRGQRRRYPCREPDSYIQSRIYHEEARAWIRIAQRGADCPRSSVANCESKAVGASRARSSLSIYR